MVLMKKFILIIVVITVLLAGTWGVRLWLQGSPLAVVHPVIGAAVQAVYATGTVEATVMMPIATHMGARLIKLNADEGSAVTKNEVLAQLEDEDIQHTIKQLQAREAFARKDYERNAALAKSNAASRKAYDQSKADWQAAQAATHAAQAQADYLKLLAPADGLIIKRDGEIGQMIPANTPVFWLSCCAPLRISAEVDEEDIAQVKNGQAVLIRADAFPGKIFHGKVQAITPKGDPISRSYRVRVAFSENTPLQIGMTVETNIIIGEHKNALLVPSSAVNQDNIWLVKDSRLVQQRVVTGAKGPERTEIKSGISEGDLVIVKPDVTLQVGRKVRAALKP